MHVGGVAGQQHPSLAVGRRLPGHVGEPGDPGRAVHPVVRPVGGDERLAEILQGGLAGVFDLPFSSSTTPYGPPPSSRLTGPMPPPSGRMPISGSSSISTSAIIQLVGRIPPGEVDAGRLADQAASSVAADEILRSERRVAGQLDIDAGVVLREAHHLAVDEGSEPRAHRPSRPGCARSGSARARARSCGGWGSR